MTNDHEHEHALSLDGTGIAAAVERIAQLGSEATGATLLQELPTCWKYSVDGEVVTIEKEAPPRNQNARDLDALIAQANHYGPEGAVYHSDTKVVAVFLDDEEIDQRHDRCVLELPRHPAFNIVTGFQAGNTHAHRDVVRMLRIDLRKFVPSGFAESIASIRVNNQGSTTSHVTQGRERGTAEFQRELVNEQAAEVPKMMTVNVPVYDVRGLREITQPIDVMIEVDLDTARIELIADRDHVCEAIESLQQHIGTQVEDSYSGRVYFGQP